MVFLKPNKMKLKIWSQLLSAIIGLKILLHWKAEKSPFTPLLFTCFLLSELKLQNELSFGSKTVKSLLVSEDIDSSEKILCDFYLIRLLILGISCCPVIKTQSFHPCGLGSIPGQGTKKAQAVQQGQKKKKKIANINVMVYMISVSHMCFTMRTAGSSCFYFPLSPNFMVILIIAFIRLTTVLCL